MDKIALSVLIPAYNEERSITKVISGIKNVLNSIRADYEIIVVNDGSTDKTKEILKTVKNITCLNHPYNKGYGAALKTGIAKTHYDWLLFFDSDGQHNPNYIKNFVNYINDYELIVGDRSQSKYIRPIMRRPGLWILHKIANYLVGYKIPDLNCGMRLVKKSVIKKYLHILPNGFSLSTTTTLAFLKDKKNVKFVPAEINRRDKNSKSMVKPSDAFTTLALILRIIMLFSPLRIFAPISLLLFIIGFGFFVYDIYHANISETTIFIFLSSLLIFFFGLIADQISAIRREINR